MNKTVSKWTAIPSPALMTSMASLTAFTGGLLGFGAVWLSPDGSAGTGMNPLDALGISLGGLSLGFLRENHTPHLHRLLGRIAAYGVLGVAAVMLLVIAAQRGQGGPGMSSFFSGLILGMLGSALLTLDFQPTRGPQPAQLLALLASYIAAIALLGHASANPRLFTSGGGKLSASAAALGFALAFGVLCARPNTGFALIIRSSSSGGVVARRLLFMPVVVPMGMGMILVIGQMAGLLSADASAWLFSTAYFCGFTLVIWWVTSVIESTESDKVRHERQFQAVAESADQAIFSADQFGTITYLNPAGAELFAVPSRSPVGHSMLWLFPERSRVEHEKRFDAVLNVPNQTEGVTCETFGVRADGTEFPVEFSLSGWRVGSDTYVTGILRDITDRKQAEEQLRAANERLADANKELESFSYSVSHDLRAPLRAIHGFSRILAEDYAKHLPEEAKEFLVDVRDNARQMGQLVDDLLAFSRLGKLPMKDHAVSMTSLVRDCVDDLQVGWTGTAVQLVLGSIPDCRGDAILLKQVWTNLLSNAWKYTRGKAAPRVEVGTETVGEAGMVTYFVRDNGAGFDMRYADKLFGVFQRLHRAEEFEGTGVGLAIVQRIVHRHGGRVWADARVGVGATFFFTVTGLHDE